ncbi:MAG: glucose-6-phosphate dehydrogenase [Candidatus Wallbacteria bacterium]|nr:glucose-6-phosphate dehydrogenase [Candidatus Wallbacteria bacterium]
MEITTSVVGASSGSRELAPDTCLVVLFGITGDLAKRKLVPAFYNLARDRKLPEGLHIIGVGREEIPAEDVIAMHRKTTERFSRSQPIEDEVWNDLARRIDYVGGDFNEDSLYAALYQKVLTLESSGVTRNNQLYYLSVPAQLFPNILTKLRRSRLMPAVAASRLPAWTRVMVEKPFGHDLDSATELNRLMAGFLDEKQIYRLDHYLGKETVQNILVFRFGNSIFEPIWNRNFVDHVQITAAENIGIEGRGNFYERTGALRDIVQNHLLQVMSLCAMEPPISFRAEDVRDEKTQVLRAIRPMSPTQVRQNVVRGQYAGYTSEKDVAPDSTQPTYVALKLEIDNWRWKGVPFYLRAGKSLSRRLTEIRVQFQAVPLSLFDFDQSHCHLLRPNVLTIRIQPDEGLVQQFMCKVPGEELTAAAVTMDFSYDRAFGKSVPEAYERLLLDAMRGDATLFARRDAVERSWELCMPILDAWASDPEIPLHSYAPSSPGPAAADELLAREGRCWEPLEP